jgi:DNA-binding response OmpR family regulator
MTPTRDDGRHKMRCGWESVGSRATGAEAWQYTAGGSMSTDQDAGATIIVIEPDVLVRMVVAKYLRECGYRVIEGTEAADVWAAIDSGIKVDIVFAEVRLTGKTNGFSLASLLRQKHPEIDVILTSSPDSAAEKTKQLCDDGPIGKPYHPGDVAARIRQILARRGSSKKT